MNMPDPVEEGAVKFKWVQSTAKPDRVVSIVELDFGKTDMTPEQAVKVELSIIDIRRIAFGVPLSRFK